MVETLGGFGCEAVETTKDVARVLARNKVKLDLEVIAHAFQNISILLARGNTSMLATRLTMAGGKQHGGGTV